MSAQPDLLACESEPAAGERLSLHDMIARKYPAPEWATTFEVANRTGSASRYADAMAFNLWNSRGHALLGFEIKVSRSDWLRELKDPAKSAPIQRFCDRWFVVTEPGIVKLDELPLTWGLMERKSRGLSVVKDAPKLKPEKLSRDFVAAFCRRVAEGGDDLAARKTIEERTAMRAQFSADLEREVARRTNKADTIMAIAEELKTKCGIDFTVDWLGPSIGDIELAKLLRSRYGGMVPGLLRVAEQLGKYSEEIKSAVAALDVPNAGA